MPSFRARRGGRSRGGNVETKRDFVLVSPVWRVHPEAKAPTTMLRRLVAALLVFAIAVPLPALARGGCQMDTPMIAPERCDCCTSPMAVGTTACATVAGAQVGCGCALRAESGSQPASGATSATPSVSFAVESALIAADLSTSQRPLRAIQLAASPPGAGVSVSRPLLCSWTL